MRSFVSGRELLEVFMGSLRGVWRLRSIDLVGCTVV